MFRPHLREWRLLPVKQRRCFDVPTPLSGPLYAVVFSQYKGTAFAGGVGGGQGWGEPSAVAGTGVRQGCRCRATCGIWFHVSGSRFQVVLHPCVSRASPTGWLSPCGPQTAGSSSRCHSTNFFSSPSSCSRKSRQIASTKVDSWPLLPPVSATRLAIMPQVSFQLRSGY